MSLIIALDPGPGLRGETAVAWMKRICSSTSDYAAGYKLGLPALLRAGSRGLREAADSCRADLLIADLKLADIGYIMKLVAKELLDMGFNAIIAHAFIGYRGALGELADLLKEHGAKLIAVTTMSHPGAEELMDSVADRLIEIALKAHAWGLVMPATRPSLIAVGRHTGLKILAPGVGAQGARPGEALCAGADYEIVGRSITMSSRPGEAAAAVLRAQKEAVEKCRA